MKAVKSDPDPVLGVPSSHKLDVIPPGSVLTAFCFCVLEDGAALKEAQSYGAEKRVGRHRVMTVNWPLRR